MTTEETELKYLKGLKIRRTVKTILFVLRKQRVTDLLSRDMDKRDTD